MTRKGRRLVLDVWKGGYIKEDLKGELTAGSSREGLREDVRLLGDFSGYFEPLNSARNPTVSPRRPLTGL